MCESCREARPASENTAQRYLGTLWELLGGSVQQQGALAWQVHVDAVGSQVVRHRQLVIAVVTHLLHDLHTHKHTHRRELFVSQAGDEGYKRNL